MLRSVEWQFVTDISGKPIGSILRVSDPSWTLEYGTGRLSGNVGKECHCTLRNIAEERRSRHVGYFLYYRTEQGSFAA